MGGRREGCCVKCVPATDDLVTGIFFLGITVYSIVSNTNTKLVAENARTIFYISGNGNVEISLIRHEKVFIKMLCLHIL